MSFIGSVFCSVEVLGKVGGGGGGVK